jgi:hypothetical protein
MDWMSVEGVEVRNGTGEHEKRGIHDVVTVLASCRVRAASEEGLSLGALLDTLGPLSFCFLSILLAAPFIQPLSLGPFTMASGLTFIMIGWQMMVGREQLTLPERVRNLAFKGRGWTTVLSWSERALTWIGAWTKPRWGSWLEGRAGARNIGFIIAAGGVLLFIPWANLPFNNTFPALMILFAALALLERDGLLVVISLLFGVITIIYFALTGMAAVWVGMGIWRYFTRT